MLSLGFVWVQAWCLAFWLTQLQPLKKAACIPRAKIHPEKKSSPWYKVGPSEPIVINGVIYGPVFDEWPRYIGGFPWSYFTPKTWRDNLPLLTARKKAQPCRYDQVGCFPHLQSLFGLYCFLLCFCSMQVSKTEPITNQLFSPRKKKHESFDGHHELRTTTPEGESRELSAFLSEHTCATVPIKLSIIYHSSYMSDCLSNSVLVNIYPSIYLYPFF